MEQTQPQNNVNNTTHIHIPNIPRQFLYIIGAFFIGALLSYLILSQQSQKETQKQTVTITGTGTIDIPADQALIYARINIAANTEKLASDGVKKTTETLKKALLAMGLSEAELTIGYPYIAPPVGNTKPSIPNPPPLPPMYYDQTFPAIETKSSSPTVLGISTPSDAYLDSYIGSNNIDITIPKNKFSLAEKIIKLINDTPDAVSDGKPFYQIKNVSPYINQAREKALLDAKEQVEKIASINKLKVKKVLSIRENDTPEMKNARLPMALYVDPLTKKAPLTSTYEVKYELAPSFLPF